jgi:hypothetical protein
MKEIEMDQLCTYPPIVYGLLPTVYRALNKVYGQRVMAEVRMALHEV